MSHGSKAAWKCRALKFFDLWQANSAQCQWLIWWDLICLNSSKFLLLTKSLSSFSERQPQGRWLFLTFKIDYLSIHFKSNQKTQPILVTPVPQLLCSMNLKQQPCSAPHMNVNTWHKISVYFLTTDQDSAWLCKILAGGDGRTSKCLKSLYQQSFSDDSTQLHSFFK